MLPSTNLNTKHARTHTHTRAHTHTYLSLRTTEFHTRLSRGPAIGTSLQKIWKSHSILISTKTRLMKALVWPVVTYGCESWTLRKNEETRLEAFQMKGLRNILCVSWTAKKTNEWVLNKDAVKRELLDTVKARKLAYYGDTMRKLDGCIVWNAHNTVLGEEALLIYIVPVCYVKTGRYGKT